MNRVTKFRSARMLSAVTLLLTLACANKARGQVNKQPANPKAPETHVKTNTNIYIKPPQA